MNGTFAYVVELSNNMIVMNFYNSKEVYNQKYFDTLRKAQNYAKKYNVTITDSNKELEVNQYLFNK
jgi:hypothetical protein